MKKHSFVELISLGLVSMVIGVTAIAYAVSEPFISLLLGLIGILFGILSLRIPKREKLGTRLSWLGILMSVISIIWSFVNGYGQ